MHEPAVSEVAIVECSQQVREHALALPVRTFALLVRIRLSYVVPVLALATSCFFRHFNVRRTEAAGAPRRLKLDGARKAFPDRGDAVLAHDTIAVPTTNVAMVLAVSTNVDVAIAASPYAACASVRLRTRRAVHLIAVVADHRIAVHALLDAVVLAAAHAWVAHAKIFTFSLFCKQKFFACKLI